MFISSRFSYILVILGYLQVSPHSYSIFPSGGDPATSTGETNTEIADTPVSTSSDSVMLYDHVAVYWLEETPTWYLGVVEVIESETCQVNHLMRKSKDGTSWVYQEDADVHNVDFQQILCQKINVQYTHTHDGSIRCTLTKEQINAIEKQLNNIV